MATLVESVQDAVIRFDRAGGIAFLSRSSETLFKCRRFELEGQGLIERIHVQDRPHYLSALSSANHGGGRESLEIRVRRDSPTPGEAAEHLWVEVCLNPVRDPERPDGPFEVVAVLRDVSARREHEAAAERARRAAEEASEAKSRFLATIGHELRTPLNAIVGFSDMMRAGIGGTLSTGHSEYAELITQSGHHLLGVINMLLDMSRIEAGKFELQVERFAPAALVEACTQMVEREARDRSIELVLEVAPNLPDMAGDERACRQILINLVSNAVKFSRDGGRVRISARRQGAMVTFAVSDSGIGMRPETVRRVGEPFYQAQEGTTRAYEGTGLGLSIVKGLVGLHEGRMAIVSESGVGTTVTVLLPIAGPTCAERTPADIMPFNPEGTNQNDRQWQDNAGKSAAG